MQSLMGETTPVAHGGNPQDRTGSPVPLLHRLIKISPISPSPHLPISPHFYYGYSTELDITC
ncbi:hypothetical protein [Moorena producens]|uniref:hypothetical protein n=1 Tax=Moorena producens TaxID=1155739 RepID=UPI00131409C1|nr:hypothetical protein [Moorena producens]